MINMINNGIILAGGEGTRLRPLTRVTNKHLLPVWNEPMIFYPLNTLIESGIDNIMIVTGKEHCGSFIELLGTEFNGSSLTYRVQEEAGGIAHALRLAKRFANGDNIAVILGDNIFENKFSFDNFKGGARIFLKEVPDAHRFGVVKIENEKLVSIEEKPCIPPSDLAVTGLYLYDSKVFDIIDTLKPSGRGELEITDVNNRHIENGNMSYEIIDGFWSDAGTFESLFRSSSFARSQVMSDKDDKDNKDNKDF